MVARTLARAGWDVAVVEEGRRHTVEEFRSRHPLERFTSLYRDGGATAALGRPPVILPIGRGVGGTTLVNSGTCYRTPVEVLTAWRDDAGLALADPDRFAPYLDEVWATLEVAPVPEAIMGNNGRLALAGARSLGWHAGPLFRNAPGCGGCCQCSIGCPRNAKFGVHLNALPQACAAGARVVSEARAERIELDGGRATGVVVRRPDGSSFTIDASVGVVVAAGATETPGLLRRSGIGSHPRLGRNLALHPSVGVAGRFDEPVVAWKGVLQSASVDEFHGPLGILIEATSTPPGMGSVLLPGYGPHLVRELEQADHLATLGAMVADSAVGRVLGRRRGVVRYDLAPSDGRRLLEAIGLMGRTLFAAGATEVITGLPGHDRVRDVAALDCALAQARPDELHVAGFHPVGTAAAGDDGQRYPVDGRGAVRGVRGVWVADASVLPTCPAVNPQVSIMALALAIADEIVAQH
jgi:choline dehydrogenase-like flavoprotein